jgi:MFS family permease
MSGSKYTWSSMNSYFASYLHYNGNSWVKPTDTYLLMPCTDFINNCVLTLGVKLGNKIGVRKTILVALGFYYFSCFLLMFVPNYYVVLLAMGIFGVGSGFGYFPPIKNCWKYYPKNNGLIFGICVGGLGLSSSILTPLADYFIVNPNKLGTDKDGYYPKEVADNLKTYLYILTGIYAFLGIFAFFLAFEYNEEEHKKEEDEKLITSDEEKKDSDKKEETKEEKKEETKEEKKDISGKELFRLFKTKKNLTMLCFCICGLFLDNLISNCARDFGNRNGVDQNYLFLLGILFGLVNGSSRFLWGYLMDKYGFKPLMSVIAAIEVILAGSFYFIVNLDLLYIICVLLIAACIGGHFSILAPLFNKVYGVEVGPQAYGLCGFFIGGANLTGPLLSMFLLNDNIHFLFAFLIGGTIVMIKIFCLFIFDEDEKFNFDEIKIDEDIGEITRESQTPEEKNANVINEDEHA